MADRNGHSQYVKLTKDQGPVDDITPGELNQPIQVPQLNIHRCVECGQVLPESYEPPADEDWATGIGGELDTMDGMAPLDVVVKILNNQLGSLMWINEKAEEFSSPIQKLATQGSAADRELMGPKFWMS
ncbi:hypothetical protein Q3G72_006130 [Acer saccharum]|nr:hypothetical protein Q3G72_006130 [Acer saccharum]